MERVFLRKRICRFGEACYRRILTRAKTELDASLFLFEIFYIEEDVDAPRPLAVDAYNESIHRLAEAFDARLIPTNAAFDKAVAARPGALWTTKMAFIQTQRGTP